jgi:hypothetical protein
VPAYGLESRSINVARRCLEYSRFAYKAYAQSCQFPMDPFYESWGAGFKLSTTARDRLMENIHDERETPKQDRKFDPLMYHLDRTPNPHHGVVYRGGTDSNYILFQPRPLDLSINRAKAFDLEGDAVNDGHQLAGATGTVRCGYFQGRTGMTENHPTAGWHSLLGAVLFDPTTRSATIVFRGSRSGDGARAMLGAQFKSRGSPDWVTDMNHLKGTQVGKYGGSTMACGFYFAYESCGDSLEAAFRWAVQGVKPRSIYVTGHSLGGALAQCAYLDLTCGPLGTVLGVQDGSVAKYCFPLSAPPVCHGRTSQHWLSLHADAANIRHYYNPKDVVHACDLVVPGMHSKGNSILGSAHPKTTPLHLGSQVALDCDEEFPNAHEPEYVWRGMNGGASDSGFWPVFGMNVVADSSIITGLRDQTLMPDLKEALKHSCSLISCVTRAQQWESVIKKEERQKGADLDFQRFAQALDAINNTQVMRNLSGQRTVQTLRRELVTSHGNPGKHSASSSVSYTLLLGLAVRQVVTT